MYKSISFGMKLENRMTKGGDLNCVCMAFHLK